ncbi:hypothetical protein ACIQU6_17310 [Streptomyces sp. NPDC090442]|uniref:hypothetical protein n=1 Tax=Streptomyces sp. NPDC090442 TaxID=3365962 RepID=UPI0037F32F86
MTEIYKCYAVFQNKDGKGCVMPFDYENREFKTAQKVDLVGEVKGAIASPDGGIIYVLVTNTVSGSKYPAVQAVDTASGKIKKTVTLNAVGTYGLDMCLTEKGKSLHVSQDQDLFRIDTSTWANKKVVPAKGKWNTLSGLSANSDGTIIYTHERGEGGECVRKFDVGSENAEPLTVYKFEEPEALRMSVFQTVRGEQLFLLYDKVGEDGTADSRRLALVAIDLDTLQVIHQETLGSNIMYAQALGISSDGKEVYATGGRLGKNYLWVYDVEKKKAPTQVDLGKEPTCSIAVGPAGVNKAYLGSAKSYSVLDTTKHSVEGPYDQPYADSSFCFYRVQKTG